MADYRIDDNAINRMLADSRIVAAFPSLPSITKQSAKPCNCSRGIGQHNPDYEKIKASIAYLPAADRVKLKALLGVTTASLQFRNRTTGKLTKLIF